MPVGERVAQAQTNALGRARAASETERWDITPDGGSAGREGRQFTVSNVGNNGRIYLRYVTSLWMVPETSSGVATE